MFGRFGAESELSILSDKGCLLAVVEPWEELQLVDSPALVWL